MSNGILLCSGLVLALLTLHTAAEPPRIHLNDTYNLVLTNNGNRLPGIELQSKSGALLADPESGPWPFEHISGTRNSMLLASPANNLGDGVFELPVRWNSAMPLDITWQWGKKGRGETTAEPGASIFPSTTQATGVELQMNEDFRFVAKGTGQRLVGFFMQSPSGSLLTGEPGNWRGDTHGTAFTGLTETTAIQLDGTLDLPFAWNHLGRQDVRYQYNLAGPRNSGWLDVNDWPQVPEAIQLSLNEQHQFVVRAEHAPLTDVRLWSAHGGLIPAQTAAPFDELKSNTEHEIQFHSMQRVTVAGELTLSAGWNRTLGYRDVEYQYTSDGSESPRLSFPDSTYPTRQPERELEITVNPDTYHLEIPDFGHELRTLSISSPGRALVFDPSIDNPFDRIAWQSPGGIVFEADEFLDLNGTLRLPVRLDPSKLDAFHKPSDPYFQYTRVGHWDESRRKPVTNTAFVSPPEVGVTHGGQVFLRGAGQKVASVSIHSGYGGLIVDNVKSGPFERIGQRTQDVVEFLGPVELDGQLLLGIEVEEAVGLTASFEWQEFGEHSTRLQVEPPAPALVTLRADPTDLEQLVLDGDGAEIWGFELYSNSGALIPDKDTDFGTFHIMQFTKDRLRLRAAAAGVPVDWMTLPVKRKWADPDDLRISFMSAGLAPVRSTVSYDAIVPEPNGAMLFATALGMLAVMRRRHRNAVRYYYKRSVDSRSVV